MTDGKGSAFFQQRVLWKCTGGKAAEKKKVEKDSPKVRMPITFVKGNYFGTPLCTTCKINRAGDKDRSLWKRDEKGIGKTRTMRPQANSAQYNTQGWDMKRKGGGVKWRDSQVKWYDNTYTFQLLLKKGLLLTVIRIRGTAETRRCDADAVRSQVITWNPALTLCASYLPHPPPYQLRPLFLRLRSLSPALLILHVVHRGVPK